MREEESSGRVGGDINCNETEGIRSASSIWKEMGEGKVACCAFAPEITISTSPVCVILC